MKRAILVFVLLTIVVTLPPLYLQWAESQRQQQIHEVKQRARPILGEPFETVLAALHGGEPPAVVILYTGGTQSHLEPCGCYEEQSGGLPRRAYVVEQLRNAGFPTLLVDAGDIFDGNEDIDARRCQTNLKALAAMGYDAVALSENDLAYGDAYLRKQYAVAVFPLLAPATAQKDFTQPFIVKQVGTHQTLAFVVGEVPEQVKAQASIIVAFGTPRAAKHVDVVIRPDAGETPVDIGTPLSVSAKPEGKTLGFLALWVDAAGTVTRHFATQLALTGDVGESEPVRQLLTDFYRQVAQEGEHGTPLFADQELEAQAQNGYVSATACRRCHEPEYLQWSATRHAFAFETLLKKERYFDPSCVPCHTTGFGYPTGFQIGEETATHRGVQCETCHGPGKQHVANPKKTTIRRGEETSLCLACHDTQHSPGFSEVVALHTKDVDHSRSPMNLKELLASRVSRMGTPTLELFVMSYCPYGVSAEEKLFPIVKQFGDQIHFKLHFIAKEKAAPSPQDITPFTSLFGYPGVAEDIRQVLIAEYYPAQYMDYILCRGKKLDKSWEECARKFNIDVDNIQTLFDSPEAEQLFRENIKRTAALGIQASPTILVDNRRFQATQLLRASGTPCQ